MYDMRQDIDSFDQKRVINVIDFKNRQEAFLLGVRSDATDFGGQTETDIQYIHNNNDGFLRMQSHFIRERESLHLQNDVMFSGWENNYLLKQEFDMFNGMRITMRPPPYPCKVGLHIKMSIGNEYE